MKKIFITLMIILILPLNVSSKSYVLDDTDIKMVFKKNWMIFTRENIKNNKSLKKINMKYNMIKDYLDTNDIYLYGLLNYGDDDLIKVIIRKTEIYNIYNLNNHSDENIYNFGKKVAKEKDVDEFVVYGDQYKFIHLNYKEKNKYLMEFHTVVNARVYSIKFKKSFKFTQDEKEAIYNIIDNLKLYIDNELKEPDKLWIL